MRGSDRIEIKIPKDITAYKESIALGLNLRQFICSVFALAASASVFLLCKDSIGREIASWLSIVAAAPLALCGFFQYNGLTLEKFLHAYLMSGWIKPRKRIYCSYNFHYALMYGEAKKGR